MNYITFTDTPAMPFPVAILTAKNERDGIAREYLNPGLLPDDEVIGYDLDQQGKKTPAAVQRAYLDKLLPVLDDLGTQFLIVGDGEYFKTLAGVKKTDPYLGYVLPNKYPENMAGRFQVVFVPNYRQVFYNPGITREKILRSLDALREYRSGHYVDPGESIIKFASYPSSVSDIKDWLEKLHQHEALTCDIEGFSLKHHEAGLGTIGFAWSKTEGISFLVDMGPDAQEIRALLRDFFCNYKGRLIWHNASYDVMVKIYQLFMEHLLDTEGLLRGLEVFYNRDWDDTKLISYLATNTCAGNELGLKIQAQEYAGNYAEEDIKDITKIPLPELLEYNLVDCLSTWFVYEKHYDKMVADDQLEIYETIFKPALIDITQMQLTGMPIDMDRVAFARSVFEQVTNDALKRIESSSLVQDFSFTLKVEAEKERKDDWEARAAKGVNVRAYVPGKFDQTFNPNSPPQLQRLLYEIIGLPVIERTKSKQPATGGEILEKLKAYTEDQQVKDLLNALIDHKKVDKILTSFIPAMEDAVQGPDGWYYLFGFFNLGGTLSGRLSSSNPNLQNLPSNVFMAISDALRAIFEKELDLFVHKGKLMLAKIIKDCFRAPPGFLLVGLDFASLEDRISALTTRDPVKLAVYIDGFDGHSLRAQSYFSENMPDIERAPEGVQSYCATIGEEKVYFHAKETITYLGQTMTGAQLWDRLANVRTAA